MDREASLKEWKEKVVYPTYEQIRKDFFEYIAEKQEELYQQFIQKIKELGKKKKEICFCHFQLPRTQIQSENYHILLFGYNSLWFLEENPVYIEWDMHDFFQVFIDWKKKLDEKRKIYLGKVNRYDVWEVCYAKAEDCFRELAIVLREWLWDLEEEEWIKTIPFGEQYQIRWGGYQEEGEIIFAMDQKKKDTKDFLLALQEDRSFFYTVWKEGKYFDLQVKGKDFFFINFKESQLENINFSESSLFKAQFCKTQIRGCQFEKANCCYARFKGAKLIGCSFRDANLTGADFRETQLEQVDFKGALVEGTCFMRKQVPFLHLSPQQLQEIVIEEEKQ